MHLGGGGPPAPAFHACSCLIRVLFSLPPRLTGPRRTPASLNMARRQDGGLKASGSIIQGCCVGWDGKERTGMRRPNLACRKECEVTEGWSSSTHPSRTRVCPHGLTDTCPPVLRSCSDTLVYWSARVWLISCTCRHQRNLPEGRLQKALSATINLCVKSLSDGNMRLEEYGRFTAYGRGSAVAPGAPCHHLSPRVLEKDGRVRCRTVKAR